MQVMNVALEGLHRAEASLDRTAERIARLPLAADPQTPPQDQISLSDEMVALIQARNAFATNTRVIQTAEEMQKTLLDILA